MSSIKIEHASQATRIYQYKNIKRNILKCCANIYFNKQCLKHKLTPNYTKIHLPHTSPAAVCTQRKISKIRIKTKLCLMTYINNIEKVSLSNHVRGHSELFGKISAQTAIEFRQVKSGLVSAVSIVTERCPLWTERRMLNMT